MKIKTRLEISAIFFICMVIAIGLTLSFITQQANEAYAEHSAVDEIVERAFMLNILTGDYLVHQEERVITQWLIVHDSLSNHLAGLELINNEEQLILDEIRHNNEDISEVFSQLVFIFEALESNGEESDLRDLMIAQLSVKLTDMVSKASLLSEASQERSMRAHDISRLLVFIFVIVIAVGIGVNSFLIITTIGKPISDLHHGVEMVRSGHLDHKVGILAEDEIGQLSRDFDEMTEELRVRSWERERAREQRKLIEAEKDKLFNDYVERLKELDCLYGISGILELKLSLDETFDRVLTLLPPAFQYPEVTCARIKYRGRAYVTENYSESSWVQSADLMINGEKVGLVEVRYLKEMPESFEGPFLKEERNMINEIAERLSRFVRQRIMEEELRERELKLEEYAQNLEGMVEDRTSELREAQEQLVRREKLAVLGQLAGGVGHELRNPLGAIKNAVYFLNMVIEDPESEIKETLEILDREVSTSEKIISSILDFARAKPPSLRKEDINEIIKETLATSSIPENIRVETQLDESIPQVLADPDQLTRVFGNIILNAVQAMPRGGQITIKTETTSTGTIALSITDQGSGIPPENLDKIFEPLFTTKARGIGLGLAVTKTIVEGHGGTIEVESEVEKGSTFTIILPRDGGKDE